MYINFLLVGLLEHEQAVRILNYFFIELNVALDGVAYIQDRHLTEDEN